MYLAKTKVRVVAVVADAQAAVVTVKAVVVQAVAMLVNLVAAVKAVVAQVTAHRRDNAPATTAVIKVSHVIHLANQTSVQAASLIKASALVAQAAVIAMAFHVVSAPQPVAAVQVAAKVVRQVVLTAVAKVAQMAATVVKTRNSTIVMVNKSC